MTVVIGEFDGDVLAKRRAADADIDGDIQYATANDGDQFSLRVRILQMQPAQNAPTRPRPVVLHERVVQAHAGVAIGLKQLGKKTALVAAPVGPDDQDFGNLSLN